MPQGIVSETHHDQGVGGTPMGSDGRDDAVDVGDGRGRRRASAATGLDEDQVGVEVDVALGGGVRVVANAGDVDGVDRAAVVGHRRSTVGQLSAALAGPDVADPPPATSNRVAQQAPGAVAAAVAGHRERVDHLGRAVGQRLHLDRPGRGCGGLVDESIRLTELEVPPGTTSATGAPAPSGAC